uniref:Cytochrome c oxidase subunit 2 n=1 Tax=Anaplecta sp. 3 MD-2014 TaxID=1554551 RepID=A0A097CTJ0_9NEOP|nr:cytochrome oxidase subunit II [Anaplecta sp. 3 MD-2014]
MSTWSNINLQDSASPIMEQLIYFHDHAMMIIMMILIIVTYMMMLISFNKNINRFMLEGQFIETTWTITPAIILVFIAIPSLRLLYLMDEINSPTLTLKTIGHQWYWSYEYSDFSTMEMDSYMIPQNEITYNMFRLLDVDNRAVLPMNTFIRMIVTSEDVLHSWTIPSLAVKADATPGRLNQISFLFNRPGVFYGQCSEICGANHSFMPIVIESVNPKYFME